ncbi:CD80 antigen, isoform CRA_a [Rattus norvegicus]|uniref:T-lymphocyte activation antigen CD80 n=2 Tax=Rattus norvegicus TaxID=10116 RepID=A6IR66_RAT|nr:T-lymphocyte activation antigen CD80 [Rattus norvegicus]NP_037058.2 T-lymphocyte activation antigen CD80 [Rattus norvegicus]EDM11215.1 CD80 antigen, isoform CRA_a [Rattus norvegicus]EDM11218.1 CD80 antigen, isoform CRA_a [Rattus norvegicus]|eukprot:XP_006248427.1 PREDICTED: T-lymphocyte activation antigen CD80 isoform X1 [Rattus norvegicus]
MAYSCQLMQESPLLGFPRLRFIHLFVLLLVGLFQISSGIVGQVSKSVREKALLSCDYKFCSEEQSIHRIYWQKHDKMVLSVISGVPEVWPEYKNRTVYDIANNYSFSLLGLILSDRGTYTCVVQRYEGGSYVVKHLTTVELSVRADFPTPNITESGNPSADIKRITCFASGGFPKPRLSWLENGRELNGINTTISQDPESELYTISSQLDFNTTYDHFIDCFIEYGDAHVSQNFTWEKPPEDPPDEKQTIPFAWAGSDAVKAIIIFFIAITVIAVIAAIAIIIFCITVKFRRCFRRRNEASRETNKNLYIGPVEAAAEQTV